ncbi:ABC transporter permease [Thermoflexus sp.]|uniref:ABC transporter permease n=1 Tax=Thermoflexus sp. TaxID=1969742 RepID=UPI0035E45474
MEQGALLVTPKPEAVASASPLLEAARRVFLFVSFRILVLAITVVIAVYLTILVANMGGYVDEIRRAEIRERVGQELLANPSFRTLSPDARARLQQQRVQQLEQYFGLDRPFLVRSLIYLRDALLLDLGRSYQISSDTGSRQVRLILAERLPPTLLLLSTSNVLIFFLTLWAGLALSRRYGHLADRLLIALTPLSAAPAWFYGVFLILIFAATLRWLPFGGMVDVPPPSDSTSYALSVLRHLILPTLALTLSNFFINAYANRTFFLIYAGEDYVEMARAKGLKGRDIERRYILRPTMPNILTSFAIVLITSWTGAPILETVFNWPGLGRVIYEAIGLVDTPVIVGATVIFAYLLALTVLILDLLYALVDPRVRIGGPGVEQGAP